MNILARITVLAVILALSGCIYAASSVIPDDKSLKLFGDTGHYVKKDSINPKKPVTEGGTFTWNGNGYALMPKTPENATKVKLAVLNAEWYVAEEQVPDRPPSYSLAKVAGKTIDVYNSDCELLSDAEVAALILTKESEKPGCKAADWDHVAKTLLKIAEHKPEVTRIYTIK